MTGCASTNTIAALLAGAVDATAAERLELHLDTCPACRRLVADLGRGLSAIDGGPRGPASELPLPGDTIGRYEIRRAIGVGGMGVVYEAQDTTLDRRVAIKLLRPELVESASLLAEARAMARLTHPNIATVHDAGTANGHVYVCMEFVAGSTLRAYRSERARSWREVVALYVAAGEGLAYVHRAGIVHRDFKPDNVLVDREGRVRVTDFGLARIVGDCARAPHAADAARAYSRAAAGSDAHCGSRIAVGSRPGVGSSRVIAGTPAYMAPEQRRGERIDARADQYAFCVSLREALGDAAPSGLVRVLERGLAELPADRYPAMDDLLAAIARGLSRKRRRIALATIAVTALVALVASMPRPTKIVRQLVDRPTPTNEMARANVDGMTRPANGIAGAANGAANGIAANGAVNVPAASGIAAANANALSHAPSLAQAAARAFASHRSAADAPFALADIASSRGEQIGADPNELPAGACDDGSPRTCAWFPPYCPATTIPAIVDGCWTCADAQTCTPLGFPRTCNDGSKLRCSQPAPICSGHRIPAIHNGCWTCADPFTCPSRPTITRSPQPPPAGSNSGSNGTPTCGNGMCESGEDHASCASDCCELGGSGSSGSGGCAAACGNGMCESGEDHASCANDCCETTASGSCVPVCGNGFCEVDEVCAADC